MVTANSLNNKVLIETHPKKIKKTGKYERLLKKIRAYFVKKMKTEE